MSKNAFSDLGFDDEEAAGLKLKSYLFISLQEAIKNWMEITGEKQADVAALIGADQAKVSKILNGKLNEFSIERITDYIQKLGYDIHISIAPPPKRRAGRVIMDKRKLASA